MLVEWFKQIHKFFGHKTFRIDSSKFDCGEDYLIKQDHNPLSLKLSDQVLVAPGMLSEAERKLLFFLASRFYTGKGAIIDGGSFFGSSVCSLATGLQNNSKLTDIISNLSVTKPITAYELGYLPAPKSDKVGRRRVFGGQEYYLGDSFVHILENTIAPYKDIIDLHIGDFLKMHWKQDTPIEICFVDFAKTRELNAHISKEFFPCFIPNKTYLIHQDFYFDRLPWIKVSMGYLSDYFEYIGQIATSAIYKCIAKIPKDVCFYDPYTMGDNNEKLKFHLQCDAPYLPKKRRFMLAISYCYLLALTGNKDEALQYLDEVEEQYPDLIVPEGQMKVIRTARARRQIMAGRMNM